MSFLTFLNQWWNFPFLVMLGLVLVFFVLQLLGFSGKEDTDVDHDVDVDADADADVDADVDADADADADTDADAGDAAAGGQHAGFSEQVFAFFGIGRVPFMVIWLTFFIFAGLTGLALNRVMYLSRGSRYPGWFFVVSLLVALVVGALMVRFFSRLAFKLVDTGGKGSTRKGELAGRLGVVASPLLDHRHGEIRVQDADGNELLVHGRLQEGEEPVKQGAKVILVDYDPASDMFWVAASPEVDAG